MYPWPITSTPCWARAKSIRQDILKMTTEAGSGHPSSSLSATEIVTALYFGGFLRHDPKNPHWPDRDRFILSKGHAAPVLYAALAQAGYFPHDEIMTLRKLGSPLEGHPNMKRLAGVEASTGSLGQGLSIGVAMPWPPGSTRRAITPTSYRRRRARRGAKLGGSCRGRQIPARQPHARGRPQPLPADRTGRGGPQPRPDRRQAHRLRLEDTGINGNDLREVSTALERVDAVEGQPSCIVALTHKGQGILNLLRKLGDTNFHGKPVPAKYLDEALAEVAAGFE